MLPPEGFALHKLRSGDPVYLEMAEIASGRVPSHPIPQRRQDQLRLRVKLHPTAPTFPASSLKVQVSLRRRVRTMDSCLRRAIMRRD